MSCRRSALRKAILFFLFWLLLAGAAGAQESAILSTFLNGERMGEIFAVIADGPHYGQKDVWIRKEEIDKTRLKEGIGGEVECEGDTCISLLSIEGLRFTLNEKEAVLEIYAPPELFRSQRVDISYSKPYNVVYTKDDSGFFNYSFFYGTDSDTANIAGEMGARKGDYLGLTTLNYKKGEEGERLVRLFTTVIKDDRAGMKTLALGDFTATSGFMGSVANMGGVSYSRNFSIDPYFLKYPPINFGGVLEYVSEVNIYVNGQLVRRIELSPGSFFLDNIPADVGLGNARVVIKDIFGRERELTQPFFFSDKLLKKGIHEYSFNMGLLRENLGEESFDYGGPAAMALHNYGLSDSLKLGYSLEASEKVLNLGPSMAVLLGNAGVLDAGVSVSSREGEGGLGAFLGYSFRSRFLSGIFSLKSQSAGFSNLSVRPEDDNPVLELNGTLGVTRRDMGSLALEYSRTRFESDSVTKKYGLSYNRAVSRFVTLFLSARRTDIDGAHTDELFTGIHVYFGKGVSGSSSYVKREGADGSRFMVERNPSLRNGFGFRAETETSVIDAAAADLRYQSEYGIFDAGYRKLGDREYMEFTAAGGVGYLDGGLFVSRPINDSFGKIKVGRLEGVRVSYFGNEVGRTDANGEIIIPHFRSFQDNQVSLEKKDIPLDYSIERLSEYVNPAFRSGAVLKFNVQRIQSFTGYIYIEDAGGRRPVEFSLLKVTADGREVEGIVGNDGEFYIENLPAGSFPAKISHEGGECAFELEIPESEEIMVLLGDIVCSAQ